MPTYAGWRRSITSDTGVVIPGAQIEVFNAGLLTKPTLYADPEGVTELTNPFDADAEGFAEFYVDGGFYRIEAGAEGAGGIWDWVAIGTAQGLDEGDVVAPADLADVATSGDHVDLLNKGTNTHAQIDAHIASTSNPHDTTLSNLDDTGTVNYTNRHCLVANGSSYVSRALVEADISDLQNYILGVDWGDIGGTLSNQTDLQAALNLKANTSSLGAAATSNDHGDLDNVGTNTHAQIDAHIADAGKHREINDAGSSATDLWSAEKITTELGNVSVGTVSTGSTIDGDGSAGSPLNVADRAITYAKLAGVVQQYVRPEHFYTFVNSDQGSVSGGFDVDVFDTANLSTVKSPRPSISNGIVSVPLVGVWEIKVVLNAEINNPNGDAVLSVVRDPSGILVTLGEVSIEQGTNGRVQRTIIVHHEWTSLSGTLNEFVVNLTSPTGSTTEILEGCSLSLTWVGATL